MQSPTPVRAVSDGYVQSAGLETGILIPARSISCSDVESVGAEVGTHCEEVAGLKRWIPLICIALSSIGFSLQALCTKELTLSGIATFQIIVIRGSCQVLGCACTLAAIRRPARTWLGESRTEVVLLSCRGLIGFGGISFGFLGVSLLPLAESQVLGQIVPIFAASYAWLFLGERWHCTDFVSALAAILGVVLIADPALLSGGVPAARSGSHLLGICCCMCSAACAGGAYVFVRLLGTSVKVHWSLVLMYQALGQALLGLCGLLASGQRWAALAAPQAALALACGTLGFTGQALMTYGMQHEKSAIAAVVRQALSPICAFLWQDLFMPSVGIGMSAVLGFGTIFAGLSVALIGKGLREAAGDATPPAGYAKLNAP